MSFKHSRFGGEPRIFQQASNSAKKGYLNRHVRIQFGYSEVSVCGAIECRTQTNMSSGGETFSKRLAINSSARRKEVGRLLGVPRRQALLSLTVVADVLNSYP